MKIKRIVYVCCIFFLFFFQLSGEAKKKEVMLFAQKNDPADTIIRHVLDSVEVYSKKIDEYNADLYIKGKVSVFKRNNLLRYIPSMFTFEKGIKDLYRTTEPDGVFSYTFFKGFGTKINFQPGKEE